MLLKSVMKKHRKYGFAVLSGLRVRFGEHKAF